MKSVAAASLSLLLTSSALAQTYEILYRGNQLFRPFGRLLAASDGNLYGVDAGVGYPGWGTVFRISPAGVLTTLHSFAGYDGWAPMAPLIEGRSGELYGTAPWAGAGVPSIPGYGGGSVFKISKAGTFTILHSFFFSDGQTPYRGALVEARDGSLVGTTRDGGLTCDGVGLLCGNVFRITPQAEARTLYQFGSAWGQNGRMPLTGVTEGDDGSFYGVAFRGGPGTLFDGGAHDLGTIFRVTLDGLFSVVHVFSGNDGALPEFALLKAADGNFYGVTDAFQMDPFYRSPIGFGTIFRLSPDGSFKTLHAFSGTDGSWPNGLIEGRNGILYGTTSYGGSNGGGTLFQVTRAGVLTKLLDFSEDSPGGDIAFGSDGALYGVSPGTVESGGGVVFKVTLPREAPRFAATKFIPIVLDAGGVGGARFTSELTVVNRGSTAADVTLDFALAEMSGMTGEGSGRLTLAPGAQRSFPNVIEFLRASGLSLPAGRDAAGTLRVHFNGLSSPDVAWAGVRTTTPSGSGRAGLGYEGVDSRDLSSVAQVVFGLRSTPEHRSNLGLANAGTAGPVTIRVTLHDGDLGNPDYVIAPDVTLAPGQWTQFNRVLDLAGFRNGYATLELVSGTEPFQAYGVINDNATNDGSWIQGRRLASLAGELVIPAIVETSIYDSEVVLANPAVTSSDVTLSFRTSLPAADGRVTVAHVGLRPGEQRVIAGAIDYLRASGAPLPARGAGTIAGSLAVSFRAASGTAGVGYASARTGARAPGGGEFGVAYEGTASSEQAEYDGWVYGLRQDDFVRSNLALVNAGSDGTASVRIDVYDGDSGNPVVMIEPIGLLPGAWKQLDGFLATFGLHSGYVHVVNASHGSKIFSYAVLNDGATPTSGGTNDGTFFALAKH